MSPYQDIFFSLLIFATFGQFHCEDYLWRDYNGTISEDAFVAGQITPQKKTYIGQTEVNGNTLLVGEVVPGMGLVVVENDRSILTNESFKILCGRPNSFNWKRSDSKSLHVSSIGKKTVIGGREAGLGYLNIGRTSYENQIKVGKITAHSMENARLVFAHGDKVLSTEFFEVLLHGGGRSSWSYHRRPWGNRGTAVASRGAGKPADTNDDDYDYNN